MKALRARIDAILDDSRVPVAAVAVINRGATFVHTRNASERTAFDLGSCSKSFVATLVAQLVDEGRLSWDEPAHPHLPELQLDTPELTRAITIRDLLCNRIGLKRQVPVESFGDLPALEVMRRVGRLDRLHPFRQGYVYFNPGFMACRLIVERITGLDYGEALHRRLFAPLGMGDSASGARVDALGERACGHVLWQGAVREVHEDRFDNWQGAAGVHSSAGDLLRWLAFNLVHQPAELCRPQVGIPREERKLIHAPPEAERADYCLGWWRTTLRGRSLIAHAGEMFAWRAYQALLPQDGIGVAVLLAMSAPRHAAIAYTVLEHLLAGSSRDWCAVADAMQAQQDAGTLALLDAAFPRSDAPPLLLARYAGVYEHAGIGLVDVVVEGDALQMRFRDGRLWDQWMRPLGGQVFAMAPVKPAIVDYFPVPLRAAFEVRQDVVHALIDTQARYLRKDGP
jgi:CubicO group peptidase (beta-lactamase class C family)